MTAYVTIQRLIPTKDISKLSENNWKVVGSIKNYSIVEKTNLKFFKNGQEAIDFMTRKNKALFNASIVSLIDFGVGNIRLRWNKDRQVCEAYCHR